MIRARFKTTSVDDPRPVEWPVKHPYWISGEGDGFAVVVAYADDEAEVLRLWPEAYEIESTIETTYTFTDRFSRPDWLTAPASGREEK